MKKINSKLIILGSGPAGCTAAIYAARSGLNPIMINGSQPGGQLTITTDVENYPGFEDPVLGPDLMQNMIKQAENVGCQTYNEQISEINLEQYPYTLKNNNTNIQVDFFSNLPGVQLYSAQNLNYKKKLFPYQGICLLYTSPSPRDLAQ